MLSPSKINNTVNHFWDRCKWVYLVNLRKSNKHQQMVKLYLIERVQNEPKATIESDIVNNNK